MCLSNSLGRLGLCVCQTKNPMQRRVQQLVQYKSNTYRLMVDLKLMSIVPNLTAFIQTILEIIVILKCVF